MTAGQALRSPQFWVLSLTYFCCCATHSGPIFHTVSYAIACGLPVMAAVTIYSVEGLAGLGGRIVFGLAGDRFGAKRVLVIGLFAQALGAGAYFFVRQLGEFYAVAAVFGLIYGGIMPLYAVIAREYFPMRIMGTVIGASTVFSAGGMALGPAVGGWIYDTTGSYGWLYIGSFGIGLGAMAHPGSGRGRQRGAGQGAHALHGRDAGAVPAQVARRRYRDLGQSLRPAQGLRRPSARRAAHPLAHHHHAGRDPAAARRVTMVALSETTTIALPADEVWPLLSDPALVASCIPGATLSPGPRATGCGAARCA